MITKELDEKLYWQSLKNLKLSQKELAKKVGENEKTFSIYVKSGNFNDDKLTKISAILGKSIDSLWSETNNPGVQPGLDQVSLLKDYKELSDKYTKLLEANSNELKRLVLVNQAVLESLYDKLLKDSDKDKSLIERIRKSLQEDS